jgi:Ca2+-binding EF-hand superfamily protein
LTKEQLFDMMDSNGDGNVDMEEMIKWFRDKQVKGVMAAHVKALFGFLDADSNGKISVNELCTLV